ncbi:MAG: hypothetical protein ACR2MA_13295, partial [Egibacteraceae bacterium]
MTRTSIALLAGALWLGCLRPGPWWFAPLAVGGLPFVGRGSGRKLGARSWRRLVGMALLMAVAGAGLAGGRVTLREEGKRARADREAQTKPTGAPIVEGPPPP